MEQIIKKTVLLSIGWISLITGLIALLIPVVPTTPFLLISAWSFSRSSERLHQWILNHRYFGEGVRNWEQERSMTKPAMIKAVSTIVISFAITTTFFITDLYLRIIMITVAIAISLFLISLPEPGKRVKVDE